jgi:hypothetical protein
MTRDTPGFQQRFVVTACPARRATSTARAVGKVDEYVGPLSWQGRERVRIVCESTGATHRDSSSHTPLVPKSFAGNLPITGAPSRMDYRHGYGLLFIQPLQIAFHALPTLEGNLLNYLIQVFRNLFRPFRGGHRWERQLQDAAGDFQSNDVPAIHVREGKL